MSLNQKKPTVLSDTMSSSAPPPPELPPLPSRLPPPLANIIAGKMQQAPVRRSPRSQRTSTAPSGDALMGDPLTPAITNETQTGRAGATPAACAAVESFVTTSATPVNARADADVAEGTAGTADASDVSAKISSFPTQAPTANTRFTCFDEAMHKQG